VDKAKQLDIWDFSEALWKGKRLEIRIKSA